MDPTPSVPSPNLFSLAGQNVLITGATRGMFSSSPISFFLSRSGIGAACAIALAEAGASICLVQRPLAPGKPPNLETLNTIRALGASAEVVYCDLDDLQAVQRVFQIALQVMEGHIHILINCAGIQRRSPSLDFPESDWDDVLRQLHFNPTV